MKKILILVFCLFAGSVMAQELFPELAGVKGHTKESPQSVNIQVKEKTLEEEVSHQKEGEAEEGGEEKLSAEGELSEEDGIGSETETETDLFEEKTKVEETEEAPVEESEEEEDEKDQKITIYMQDADATITPNRDFSYCFGILKILNTLKKPVQALDVVLNYGGLTTKYNIRNLQPQGEQTGSITLMGRACETILDMPEMTINACKVEDMKEATCKKKVEFLPLRGE